MQGETQDGPAEPKSGGSLLEAKLIGRLPCVFCGYELQGLSIRGQCPECGAAVRATILHRVDPAADEFAPIYSRRIVALGLVLWPLGALLAAAASWAQRGLELLRAQFGVSVHLPVLGAVVVIGVLVSAVGAIGLIRPTRETSLWKSVLALLGLAMYVPLVWAVWHIGKIDAVDGRAYWGGAGDLVTRARLKVVMGVSLAAAVLLARPICRDLVRRSMAMRTGRVDRQALLLVALAALLAAGGDVLRYMSARYDWCGVCDVAGTPVVAVGSLLLTIGVVGSLLDGARIARVVLRPPPSLRDVIGDAAP